MSINLLFSEYRVVRFDKFPNSFGASPVTSFPSHQLHHSLLTWVLRILILRSFWWFRNTWHLQFLTTWGGEETARNSLLREWQPGCCTWHHQFICIRKVGDHWQPRGQNDLSNLKVLKVSKSNWKWAWELMKLIYFGFSHRSCTSVSLIQGPSWAVGKLKLRKLCLLKSCSVGGISA